MVTALQIILVLVLISLIGIIIGYLFGKLYCTKGDSSKVIEKGTICEEIYNENLLKNNQEDTNTQKEPLANDSIEVDTQKDKAAPTTAQPLVSQTEDKEDSSVDKNEPSITNEEAKDTATQITLNEKETTEENIEPTTAQPLISKTDSVEDSNLNNESDNNIKTENSDNSATSEDINKEEVSSNEDNNEESKDLAETQKPQSFLSEPNGGEADNLCRIKGIGVVIEEKLKNLGIFHFEQIANFTEDEIAWIDEHLAFKGRIKREDWVSQAKLLAEGKETEFSKRVDSGEVESSKKS